MKATATEATLKRPSNPVNETAGDINTPEQTLPRTHSHSCNTHPLQRTA